MQIIPFITTGITQHIELILYCELCDFSGNFLYIQYGMSLIGHGNVIYRSNWVVVVEKVVLIPLFMSFEVVALFL